MPVILVLGANGFIGSHVVQALAGKPGIELAGAGLGSAPSGLERGWLDLDLLAAEGGLADEIETLKPAVVVNCTGATVGTAQSLVRLNVGTTEAILGTLEHVGSGARLVHLGSAAEYGPGPVGVPVTESMPAAPVSDYGAAKLAATKLVLAARDRGRDAVVLRVFNPVGPAMPETSLPGAAAKRLREATAASLPRVDFGPLGSVRDFVDVRDVAAAVARTCLAPSLPPPLVNVGTGTGHPARDLVAEIAVALGFRGDIAEAAAGSPRSADVPWQVADISLARAALAWEPAYELRASVEFMLAEGRSNA